MDANEYAHELNVHISHLYVFARKLNELDFAGSLNGEFRGAQDAGWATTETAFEVFQELIELTGKQQALSKGELRVVLMLYCQLAEAGGFYETLKNVMRVVTLKPYVLWPFQDLVRVRKTPKAVIGPNANATFRDLATYARDIGMSRLSHLLEIAFRDDIRNGIAHADYVIKEDGLRLRKRNGGYPAKVSFEEISAALTRAMNFFELLKTYNYVSMMSFNPAREIVGRFSSNRPMSWTVSCTPGMGFSMSSSSPGACVSPEFVRQEEINGRLGGKVFAVYTTTQTSLVARISTHIEQAGFEPHDVVMDAPALEQLLSQVTDLGLWDDRAIAKDRSDLLLASPWGFRWISTPDDFDQILLPPLNDLTA